MLVVGRAAARTHCSRKGQELGCWFPAWGRGKAKSSSGLKRESQRNPDKRAK